MFRMTKSGFPVDPHYPINLTELGYFVNDQDEIRSIANPTHYFKYFLTKNSRYNVRHREAMNTAIRDIVDERLSNIDMVKYHCSGDQVEKQTENIMHPNPDTAVPHIPILASKNVGTSPRVIVLFGESFQDLGIFAQRIIGLHGGMNVGSAVNFIRLVQALEIDADTGTPIAENETSSMQVKLENPEEIDLKDLATDYPGIILANTGQLKWARGQGRAITHVSWDALPRPSAVDEAVRWDPTKNTVLGHRTEAEHVGAIFASVIPQLCDKNVKLDIIALGDSCEHVPTWLDQHWDSVKKHISSMAMICPGFAGELEGGYKNSEFKHFLVERTRGWLENGEQPAGTPLFGPHGGSKAWQRAFGFNMYSLPAEMASEMVFPKYFNYVLEWIEQVAKGGEKYCEDEIQLVDVGEEPEFVHGLPWKDEESAEERGLITGEESGTEEGMLKMATNEKDRDAARAAICYRKENVKLIEEERKRIDEEIEKYWGWGEDKDVGGVDGGPKERDDHEDPVYEIAETDTEHPELYEWHQREGSEIRWRQTTKEEIVNSEEETKKRKREGAGKQKEKGGFIIGKEDEVGEKSNLPHAENADLPPTNEGAPEICTKKSVENTTHSLIADLKTLDIATHTALPSTPQLEPPKQPPTLHITNRTPFDNISDDEEEFPIRQSSSSISPLDGKQGPAKLGVTDLAGAVGMAGMAVGGTKDEDYMACPPERMERLPSDVALGLSTGMPEVELSRDIEAALLQRSVLTSPETGYVVPKVDKEIGDKTLGCTDCGFETAEVSGSKKANEGPAKRWQEYRVSSRVKGDGEAGGGDSKAGSLVVELLGIRPKQAEK